MELLHTNMKLLLGEIKPSLQLLLGCVLWSYCQFSVWISFIVNWIKSFQVNYLGSWRHWFILFNWKCSCYLFSVCTSLCTSVLIQMIWSYQAKYSYSSQLGNKGWRREWRSVHSPASSNQARVEFVSHFTLCFAAR